MDIRLLAAGCVLSLVVAATAYALRLLTLGGAAAAVAVGTLVFGFGGSRHAGLLVLFFVTSSALTAGLRWASLETQPAAIWRAGSMGMRVDRILGATVEGRVRGLTNDAVNLLATLSGAVVAVVSAGSAGSL